MSKNEQQRPRPYQFPFTALEGQRDLQRALLLCAVDPMIGGLLIQGPRGTAKSTSARALAELLPAGRFVNLPLAASEEQLVGSLDIDAALKGEGVQFRPGLFARAHAGVLYVDEVNLLPDHLVDLLLDVSASGVNIIERDGISHVHESRFVLIGTMNPEEGELRPQLLDRFGLFLQLPDATDLATRQQIVSARLRFDADPAAFVAGQQQEETALRQGIAKARARLQEIDFLSSHIASVGRLCSDAEVEGVRADLTLLRAARANAALEGRAQIEQEDMDLAAPWVLGHRCRHPSTDATTDAATDTAISEPQNTPPRSGESETREAPNAPEFESAGGLDAGSSGSSGAHPGPNSRAAATREESAAARDDALADWGALRASGAPAAAQVKALRPLPQSPKKR